MKTATTSHECEHMDKGACRRCKGTVPFLSGEVDKPLAPLAVLNSPAYLNNPMPFTVRYPR